MSWKATAFVKELRDGLSISDKLVLLILADYHRTDGKNEWPSSETLGPECLMTRRGVLQVLARLEGNDFIRRERGGGRGNTTAYKIVGLDCEKGELKTLNIGSLNEETLNETVHSDAENSAQPGDKQCTAVPRNKVLQVLPVIEPNGGEPADDSEPSQHPLNQAHRMIEMLSLPSTWKLKEIIAAAIVAESKFQGVTEADAAKYVAGCAMVARQRGVAIDKFYFEDTKWRVADGQGSGNRQSGAGTPAQTRSQRSIDSLRRAAGRYAAKTNPRNQGEREG